MDPRRGHPGAVATELGPAGSSRLLSRGLLLAAAGALVAFITAGSDADARASAPAVAPTTEAVKSWEGIALDFEGMVAPRVLLGGGGEDPELLQQLARLGLDVESFRAIGRGLMEEVAETAAWRDREERRVLAGLIAQMPLPADVDVDVETEVDEPPPVERGVFEIVRRLQVRLPTLRRELTP